MPGSTRPFWRNWPGPIRAWQTAWDRHGRAPAALEAKAESELLLAVAPHLEAFIADLFGDRRRDLRALAGQHSALAPLYACKRLFVQRRAARAFKAEEAAGFDADGLRAQLSAEFGGGDQDLVSIDGFELAFATRRHRLAGRRGGECRRASIWPPATPPGRC